MIYALLQHCRPEQVFGGFDGGQILHRRAHCGDHPATIDFACARGFELLIAVVQNGLQTSSVLVFDFAESFGHPDRFVEELHAGSWTEAVESRPCQIDIVR